MQNGYLNMIKKWNKSKSKNQNWSLGKELCLLVHGKFSYTLQYNSYTISSKSKVTNICRCKCGNCSVALLQNISECYCCDELDGCGEALQSDLVVDDVGEKKLRCITDHPGFQPVCLEKWSLRLAADRYNRKSKTRYRQTGSENE